MSPNSASSRHTDRDGRRKSSGGIGGFGGLGGAGGDQGSTSGVFSEQRLPVSSHPPITRSPVPRANRERHGFNAAWVNLLCASYTAGRADASTYDGILPFTKAGDLSTPNEAFFQRVDHMLAIAARHGINVFLVPAETGSFLSVVSANGTTKARAYGQYLGARYQGVDNMGTVTVDMTKLRGQTTARWYDPSNGTYTAVAASPLANQGTHDFKTPGPNGDGNPDWVLVLEAV